MLKCVGKEVSCPLEQHRQTLRPKLYIYMTSIIFSNLFLMLAEWMIFSIVLPDQRKRWIVSWLYKGKMILHINIQPSICGMNLNCRLSSVDYNYWTKKENLFKKTNSWKKWNTELSTLLCLCALEWIFLYFILKSFPLKLLLRQKFYNLDFS